MKKQLNLLLADDDNGYCFFFNKVLEELPVKIQLATVEDGEELMQYLSKNRKHLPDLLFLDLNMPRKNGSECLEEIKRNKKLKNLPVIIYSSSLNEDVADLLYQKGAHYYIRKTDCIELKKTIHEALRLRLETKFKRPEREGFVLNMIEA